MKKKYLTYAGIISALILVCLFIVICMSPVPCPFLGPSITFDPITDTSIDNNNIMSLTGTTTLPENSFLSVKIIASPRSVSLGEDSGRTMVKGSAQVLPVSGGNNRWRSIINISPLEPADYTISLATINVTDNFTWVESDPIATQHFTLTDENAGTGSVRKKTRIALQFIRINTDDQEPTAETGEISGITSLEPDTLLAWSMHAVTSGTGNNTKEHQGTTRVVPGTVGVNRWYVEPGTDALTPARYQFRITGNPTRNSTSAETISAIAEINISLPAPVIKNTNGSARSSSGFVTIDALPEMRINDIYQITGTTGLPVGDDLLVQVYPSSFDTDYYFTIDPKEKTEGGMFSGAMGTVSVVKGSDSGNLWSFELQTYQMDPGKYEVNVSNDKYDSHSTSLLRLIPGDISGMKKFTLKS
jgi:hypothetical protein